jgi:8-amino-7-oxononanoate synthase
MSYSTILQKLKNETRFRAMCPASGVDLSSNDYLGFLDHPFLKQAAIEAIDNGVGLGSGGSRLLRGNAPEHEALEKFAAAHYGFERALYFSNGFAANQAVLRALPDRKDIVIYDTLVHASMRDALFSPVIKSVKAAHNDLDAFENALKRHRDTARRLFIAVESVYSMDGDVAPLEGLYALAQRYDALLIVDEAHGTGVFGHGGRGLADSLPREHLIVVHTCGKALGVAGGLVCASADIIEYLINTARPFIYSTAPPPLQAYLTQKAIELCESKDGDEARARLHKLRALAKHRLGGAGTQIVPIIMGEDKKAMSAAEFLQSHGYDIRAVRPPTVPEGTARLRLSLNAKLTEENLSACFNLIDTLI